MLHRAMTIAIAAMRATTLRVHDCGSLVISFAIRPKPLMPILVGMKFLWSYSSLRMTAALAGHAEVNSMEVWTVAGTSVRAIRSNPNFGKYRSAVVVNR
jgi:hypothetical protein